MPVQLSYPGVYIEELPSGVHTITGVPTSVTAFVGRASKGPLNAPTTCFSFGDYVRFFGLPGHDSSGVPFMMGYSVEDFFLNGGGQAVIVRVAQDGNGTGVSAGAAAAAASTLGLNLVAASPGVWGNNLVATIDYTGLTPPSGNPGTNGAPFNLTITQLDPTNPVPETFSGVSNDPNAGQKRLDRVLTSQSKLARAADNYSPDNTVPLPTTPLAAKQQPTPNFSGGVDPVPTPASAAAAASTLGLNLVAASPGGWGNNLLATIDFNGMPPLKVGESRTSFNLMIKLLDPANPVTERFINVSNASGAGPKRLDNVLASQSMLVRVSENYKADGPVPTATQQPTPPAKPLGPNFSGGGDGGVLTPTMAVPNDSSTRTGVYALMNVDIFNILCIPLEDPANDSGFNSMYQSAAGFCVDRRAMLVLDAPSGWLSQVNQQQFTSIDPSIFNFTEDQERNSAVYFPHILRVDQVDGMTKVFPACGTIAGQMSAVDARRGVWKAPAGIETALGGIAGLELKINDGDNGQLNPMGINCLRTFPVLGSVIWGARTLRGADIMEDDYKYVPVRRLTLFLEESLVRGTKWAVFEPNDETLWSSLRTSIGSFMATLSNQGAFYDYQVICDKTTTTATDIELGVVNVIVAFAPVKPAEFVVLKIQMEAGVAPG